MKIKQLEWIERGVDRRYVAHTNVGNYYQAQRVNRLEEVQEAWEVSIFVEEELALDVGEYPTLNDAKAAAQADFEQRVMACFEEVSDED